jgi:multidrug resistance efflux pump
MSRLRYLLTLLLLFTITAPSIAQQSLSLPVAQDDAKEPKASSDDENSTKKDKDDDEKEEEKEVVDKDEDKSKDDDDEKSEKKKEKKPKEVSLKGNFVASDQTKVMRRLNEWSEMRVISAVDHGTKVRKGDVLVELETKKIDLALEGLKHDLRLAEISMKLAEKGLELLRKSTPLAEELAERSERKASDDLKRFITIDKEASKKSYDFSLQSAENYLAYQSEELKQLEQMYEADDLTEQSEEIILKRTRDQVKQAQYSLERAKRTHKRGHEVDLPRREETLEDAVKQAAIELERSRLTLPSRIEQKELELKKQKISLDKTKTKLKHMREDREALTIKAPTSGYVYYGECKKGKWTDPSSMASMFKAGGSLKSNSTFMTVVDLRPLHIETSVSEKDLRHATKGTKVKVEATAFPDLTLEGTLVEIAAIPTGSGTFAAKIKIDLPDEADAIVPGMSCTAKIVIPVEEKDNDDEEEEEEEDDEK